MPSRTTIPTPERPDEDYRNRLIELRDLLTQTIKEAPPAYRAALARQLQAVLAELASLPDPGAEPSLADQLRARRAARIAGYRADDADDDDKPEPPTFFVH